MKQTSLLLAHFFLFRWQQKSDFAILAAVFLLFYRGRGDRLVSNAAVARTAAPPFSMPTSLVLVSLGYAVLPTVGHNIDWSQLLPLEI